jgi:hypothetical protein
LPELCFLAVLMDEEKIRGWRSEAMQIKTRKSFELAGFEMG